MVGAGSWRIDFVNKKSFIDKQMRSILEAPDTYKPSLKHALHFFDMDYHDDVIKSFNDLSNGTPVFDKVIKMMTYTNKSFWAHAISRPALDAKPPPSSEAFFGLRAAVFFEPPPRADCVWCWLCFRVQMGEQ